MKERPVDHQTELAEGRCVPTVEGEPIRAYVKPAGEERKERGQTCRAPCDLEDEFSAGRVGRSQLDDCDLVHWTRSTPIEDWKREIDGDSADARPAVGSLHHRAKPGQVIESGDRSLDLDRGWADDAQRHGRDLDDVGESQLVHLQLGIPIVFLPAAHGFDLQSAVDDVWSASARWCPMPGAECERESPVTRRVAGRIPHARGSVMGSERLRCARSLHGRAARLD